ncbi:MAG: arylsulfatase [Verrucomicrobiota bacterium]
MTAFARAAGQPNIVIVYADDMGYGDLACQNPEAKFPTPFLDELAGEGMRFTDGHSSSGICTPSRFALLTGQYHWRRMHGIVGSFGGSVFQEGDVTLPQVLRENGYATACVGKWHLGWHWDELIKNPPSLERTYWDKTRKVYAPEDIDWSLPIQGGPLDWGFDYYFGDGTINFPPYAWIENDRFLATPTEIFEFDGFERSAKEGDWDSRPGPMVKGWDPYEVLPTMTQKAVSWIFRQSHEKPFFLYFPLPSPHMPVIPNDHFDGRSDAGPYGDFMVETDWAIGQILLALKAEGFEENTIVVFSSDNGPEWIAWERAETYGHFSMGSLRGLKRDVWEGGHRVPFLVKWPGHIEAGSVSDEVISQVDLMATLLNLAGLDVPAGAAPDSYDFTPVWKQEEYLSPFREATIQNTGPRSWAVRKGDWSFINSKEGVAPKQPPENFAALRPYEDLDTEGLLFNLGNDLGQRENLYAEHPDVVNELEGILARYRELRYSVDHTEGEKLK